MINFIGLSDLCRHLHLTTSEYGSFIGDTAGSVSDHHDKLNIIKKWVNPNKHFGFPVPIFMFILYYSL